MKKITNGIFLVISFLMMILTSTQSLALKNDNAPSMIISEDSADFLRVDIGIPYVIDENTSKTAARNIALKENNINMSQLAGKTIHFLAGSENDENTQQKIAQLASNMLISKVESERFYVAGQNMGVYLSVKVDINKKAILAKLKKINEDKVLAQKFAVAVQENNSLLFALKELDRKRQLAAYTPTAEWQTERQKLLNTIYTNNASYEDDANNQLAIENAQKVIQDQTSNDIISIESIKHSLSNIVPTIVATEAIYTSNKIDNSINIEINVAFEPSSEPIPATFKGEQDAYGLKNLQLKGFDIISQPTLKLTAQDIEKGKEGVKGEQTVYIVKKRKSKISPRSKALVEDLNKLQVKIELMIGEYSASLNLTKHNIDNLSFQFKGNEQVKLKNIPKEIASSLPLTTRVVLYTQED